MNNHDLIQVEARTLEWVNRVVVGLNLCPFASPVIKSGQLLIHSEPDSDVAGVLTTLVAQCDRVQQSAESATLLLVLPNGFEHFDDYLDLVALAEALLEDIGLEGVLQLATFHPDYQFSETEIDDAANYTNRSPFPMLHILQERSVERALQAYAEPEAIPQRNIDTLRALGVVKIEQLLHDAERPNADSN